ncbi:hypothetical protein WICANDRAFT_71466, partial [Wickerhamomyces anomalus NRRL Y-366-8]
MKLTSTSVGSFSFTFSYALLLLLTIISYVSASSVKCSSSDIVAGCSNLDFSYNSKNTNKPTANIAVTGVTWLGGNSYQVTIHFKSSATMSLSSLSELKVIGIDQTYVLYSNNMKISRITNPGEWDATFTVTASNSNGRAWMPTGYQVQFDWCSAGVTSQSECNRWKYAKSYDYNTGCNNYNNYGQSQTDSSGYYWPINCGSGNNQDTTSTTSKTTSTTSPSTTLKTTSEKTTSKPQNGDYATPYAQCGGNGFAGASICTDGYYCSSMNDYYYQCVPGTATTSASKPTTAATSTTSTQKTTSSTSTSTSKSNQNCVSAYGQCGGANYGSPSCCTDGYYCSSMNDYYYQCVPGTATSTSTSTSTTTSAKQPTTTSTSSTSTSSTTTSKPTTASATQCVSDYGQCGGVNYVGPNCC